MPQFTKKRLLLAKVEATYGTDSVPTGAANAILLTGDPTITPLEGGYEDLNYLRPYFGNSPKVPVNAHVKVSFETFLFGSGSAGTAPVTGVLFRGCGCSQVITAGTKVDFARQSSNFESLTLYFYLDGVLHKVTGAMGNVSASFEAGKLPRAKWEFTGLFNQVTDAGLPAATFTGWNTPQAINKTNTTGLSLFGVASPVMSSFNMDLKNNVVYESLVGLEDVAITDSKPEGSIVIRSNTMAVKNWFDSVKNADSGTFSFTHGTTAGNKVIVSSPSVNLSSPEYQDLNGVQMLKFGIVPLPSAGNDELLFSFQ